ncbi:MAG: bifunctional glutamate N-acetyltransferase/amino-acid acetyltransferase ArgJ [Geminicoccaceae bacterium]|nr:bifunctional glutamate N-acetyltransferase/amino-acid acetyltransferase ArgJ [Geminicoccaceae bacterium]
MAEVLSRSPLAPERFPEIPPVPGVRFSAVAAGIRYRDRLDLMLLEVPEGSSVAGVLTRSATPGHPVLWCRKHLPRGRARAVIANAGNANVFRGAEGDRAVEAEARAVAAALHCPVEEVFVASTGVIGERLPVERITARVPELVRSLCADGIAEAARAIMTTDTFPKGAFVRCTIDGVPVTVAGIAKGSGMIAPDMATMLAFLVTDARLPASVLQPLLAAAADASFHCITVDGDTSTSDTLLLLASGRAPHHPVLDPRDSRLAGFVDALAAVCGDLALQVVRDGEGAQKLVAITVEGAVDDASARRIGLTVANSPLVKTAIAGGDANWGRVVAAVGRAKEPIEPEALSVAFGGHWVARDGAAVPDLDEAAVSAHLAGREVHIALVVGRGPGRARVWTCDLTRGYVDINTAYRS